MLRRPTMDPESKTFKFKICLVGEEGVGKTSLIHRFVSGAFDESYIRTLGAVVSKKTVALGSMQGRPVQVDMMILDIRASGRSSSCSRRRTSTAPRASWRSST